MARYEDRLDDNAPGDFFVDRSCIDCDLCRQLAPDVFGRTHGQSYVHAQPHDPARALVALVTCPTSSIGTTRKLDTRAAARSLPEPISDDVYFVGWASEDSYGAASYLIRRPAGNVLVDSPRAASTLFERLDELGGVAIMFLTHRDDIADHAKFHARFGCERVIHRADGSFERTIDSLTELAPDLRVIPVPGHTRGSSVLIYRDTFAFTGDHVWASDGQDQLEAGRDVCWYSWREQKASMARLAEHRFTHVLPGHGRRFVARDHAAMRAELRRLAESM